MNNIAQNAVQMGEVYQGSDDRTRLFRKHNGFSPDQVLNITKKAHEVVEKKQVDKIERITKEKDATIQADGYLRKLMTAAKVLSNPTMAASFGAKDAFGSRSVALVSSDSALNADSAIKVSPSFGAPEGGMSIKVERIATKDMTTGLPVASKTTNITANATYIYIKGEEIKIAANASLEEIALTINTKTNENNVSAYIRKYSDTDYRLCLSNTKDGEKITFETIANKLSGSFTDSNVALNLAGTLVIGGQDVVISPLHTLSDVAALIGAVPNFAASIGGAGPYTLDVTENATPVLLSDQNITKEKLFAQLGLTESNVLADDLKAKFFIDADVSPITSSTNHIEGLYPKTTIDLLRPTGGATITADIERDPSEVESAIEGFVDAYNELIKFANTQTAKDPKNNYEPMDGAYLAKNRQFITMIDRIKLSYTATTSGVSGLKHMSEVGIRKDENGLLTIDNTKLSQALKSDLSGVEQIFGFITTNTTGGYFQVNAHPKEIPNLIAGKNVKVSITKNATSQYSACIYIDNNGVAEHQSAIAFGASEITVTSTGKVTVKGPKGSTYEGFEFFYFGPEMTTPVAPALVTEEQGFKFTQGIGDRLTNRLEDIVLLTILSDQETDQKNELNKISFKINKEILEQEKKLKDLRAKQAKEIKKEELKAERFQSQMAKVGEISAAMGPIMASMLGSH